MSLSRALIIRCASSGRVHLCAVGSHLPVWFKVYRKASVAVFTADALVGLSTTVPKLKKLHISTTLAGQPLFRLNGKIGNGPIIRGRLSKPFHTGTGVTKGPRPFITVGWVNLL